MTDRQFSLWMLWFRHEWNRPSRSDHYLMQIAAVQIKDASWEKLQIPFQVGPRRPMFKTKEEAAAAARAMGLARVAGIGPEVVHKTRTRAEAIALGLIEE
jgi:hypothetical protein